MNDQIVIALVGIVPALISSVVSYKLALRKFSFKSDDLVRKEFKELSEKFRLELKKELDECRTDRDEMRKEYDELKKELDKYKKENEMLKKELNELESKLDAANEVIAKLVDVKKKNTKK